MSLNTSESAGSSSNPNNAASSSSAPSSSKQPGLVITVPTPIRPSQHSLKRDRSGSFKVPTSATEGSWGSAARSALTPKIPLARGLSTASTMLGSSPIVPESPVPQISALNDGSSSAHNSERQLWKDAISELADIVKTLLRARELIKIRDEKTIIKTRLKKLPKDTTVVDGGDGWGQAATISKDPRGDELDTRISELGGEISTLMNAFESELSKWAARQEDFWPFEPQGGRCLDENNAAAEEGWGASRFQNALNGILTDMSEAGPWIDTLEQQWQYYTTRHEAFKGAKTTTQPETAKSATSQSSSRASDPAKRQRRILALNAGIAHMKEELEDVKAALAVLNDQITDLEAGPLIAEPNDQQSAEPVDKHEVHTEKGAEDLQRLVGLLVDWTRNLDQFEQMTRERPRVIQLLKTQREQLKAKIEGLRARELEQDTELASLKELVLQKFELLSAPSPPSMPTREEAIAFVARDVVEELRGWLDSEFEAMYQNIRNQFDGIGVMAREALGPVLELLEACLAHVNVDANVVPSSN
ncbi:hypothetical protein FRB96_003596 [Tulasnella sp. 330]|nr:hypothetical protein FRB96_003596 [Tulasnella sp. 330]KAG8886226.1 hypothetical protein FRB97_006229 [Tulasnella sp. 331]KAG8887280.1 hypothetical protein FRB98_000266 [Tulasnella sp. 332]